MVRLVLPNLSPSFGVLPYSVESIPCRCRASAVLIVIEHRSPLTYCARVIIFFGNGYLRNNIERRRTVYSGCSGRGEVSLTSIPLIIFFYTSDRDSRPSICQNTEKKKQEQGREYLLPSSLEL